MQLRGERLLIIGGGLTSGHLAIGAINRGAQVLLISRRQLYEKLFDADPGWLGPKYLQGFWAESDWHRRWQMIQQARNGGSMTPAILTQLRRLARDGRLELYEDCQVLSASWSSDRWQLCCDHAALHDDIQTQQIDRIWLATGSQIDATRHPLLKDILEVYPTEVINGLPVVDECSRWRGCELFMMGGLAALCVGPTARNLSGARAVSGRIVPALTKASLALSSHTARHGST